MPVEKAGISPVPIKTGAVGVIYGCFRHVLRHTSIIASFQQIFQSFAGYAPDNYNLALHCSTSFDYDY